jgi:hypothetical protein
MNPEQKVRYDRWFKAAQRSALNGGGPNWQALDVEEQAAWDDMADHDDPEYVKIVGGPLV